MPAARIDDAETFVGKVPALGRDFVEPAPIWSSMTNLTLCTEHACPELYIFAAVHYFAVGSKAGYNATHSLIGTEGREGEGERGKCNCFFFCNFCVVSDSLKIGVVF